MLNRLPTNNQVETHLRKYVRWGEAQLCCSLTGCIYRKQIPYSLLLTLTHCKRNYPPPPLPTTLAGTSTVITKKILYKRIWWFAAKQSLKQQHTPWLCLIKSSWQDWVINRHHESKSEEVEIKWRLLTAHLSLAQHRLVHNCHAHDNCVLGTCQKHDSRQRYETAMQRSAAHRSVATGEALVVKENVRMFEYLK